MHVAGWAEASDPIMLQPLALPLVVGASSARELGRRQYAGCEVHAFLPSWFYYQPRAPFRAARTLAAEAVVAVMMDAIRTIVALADVLELAPLILRTVGSPNPGRKSSKVLQACTICVS